MAARELDLSSIANKSWQGQHLINTHGCGLVEAPSGQISDRRPVYHEVELERPEMYFSDDISGYAIVDTGVAEETCPGYDDPGPYSGTGGIKLDSVFKRMAFALSYLDYNMIGSKAIDDDSRLVSIRRVEDRAKKLAPFLSFDNDPYPVALDGRVLWVIDAYTTSDRYPYGESGDRKQLSPGSGLDHPFNYVRNSIKVVVDAYDGTVDFYIIDDVDPIAKVWQSAFPGLFKTKDQMPAGLDAHLRYPEELFRVQTAAYSKYRLSPDAFFGRTGAWSVAQAPIARPRAGVDRRCRPPPSADDDTTAAQDDLATESGTERFVPYYSMLRSPGETAGLVQAAATVRAVLHRRQQTQPAGVHDGQQRPAGLRLAGRVRGDVGRGRAVHRLQHDEHRIQRVAAAQPAQHRRHRRGVRRPADGAAGRRSVVGATGVRAADGHRPAGVAADDRVGAGVAEQERRVRQFAQRRVGEAVPRLRRRHRRRRRRHARRQR